jgi:hypothetical protein
MNDPLLLASPSHTGAQLMLDHLIDAPALLVAAKRDAAYGPQGEDGCDNGQRPAPCQLHSERRQRLDRAQQALRDTVVEQAELVGRAGTRGDTPCTNTRN